VLLAISISMTLQLATAATTRGFIALAVPPMTNAEATAAAIDLNGDAHADNQLGSLFVVLSNSGFDFAVPVDSGEVVYLLRVTSSDAAFQTDAAAHAEWIVGQPTAPTPPDFSGNGSFQADPLYAPGMFTAPLVGANFVSANPVTTTAPVDVPLNLFLGSSLVLPLNGARLTFTVAPSGLMQGQINGSVRSEDIQVILIPGLTVEINQIIASGSPSAAALLGIFDTGCNGVGANDGIIDVCEVQGNGLIVSATAPDVDIYAANGSYAPNPANTNRDSLSFGMRFTAANAQVTPRDVIFANSFDVD
jgi:hypothetical protein